MSHELSLSAARRTMDQRHAETLGRKPTVLILTHPDWTEPDLDGPLERDDGQDEDATEPGALVVSPELRGW